MAKINKNIVATEKPGKNKTNVGEKKNAAKSSQEALPAKLKKVKKPKQLTALVKIPEKVVAAPKSIKTKKPDATPADTSVADSNDSGSENENELDDSTVPKQKGGMCCTVIVLSIHT